MACSWALPAVLMQLRDLGRERVTRRMWGAGNESFVKELGGGGVENMGVVMVDVGEDEKGYEAIGGGRGA